MTETELIEIERQLWTSDADYYQNHLTESALLAFPETGLIDRSFAVEAIRKEGQRWAEVRFDDVRNLRLTDDVILLTYQSTARKQDETSAQSVLASSVYVKNDGAWKLAFHQQSPVHRPSGAGLIDRDAVANIAVRDLDTARRFYEDTLGLHQVDAEGDELIVFRSGRSTLNVYRSEYAGTNEATAVTWMVGDAIDEVVRRLKTKGVTFEHYDMPGMTLNGDIHVAADMKVAWFKDSDGNILNLVNR